MQKSKKIFNTRGVCIPEDNYMVDISGKINQIVEELINTRSYFTINRPRQYGKTTTLYMLAQKLKDQYLVISLSFEGLGQDSYANEKTFIDAFFMQIKRELRNQKEFVLFEFLENNETKINTLSLLSEFITNFVNLSPKPVVLLIDEVDKSSNNQLFLDFLGILRNKYLLRNEKRDQTFHSVILAGVHDIKTIKAKIKKDTFLDKTNEQARLNSPWNIAADFIIEMSFNSQEISTMLQDFSQDCHVAMDIPQVAERIYFYTSGYPFLTSRICELIYTRLKKTETWTLADIDEAVKLILQESNTNFDSLIKNLENNDELYSLVKSIIIEGEKVSFNTDNPIIKYGILYGMFKKQDGVLKIHNKIYEQRIYNYMSSKIETTNLSLSTYNFADNFIINNALDMERVLLKFQQFMKEQYSTRDEKFWERHGKIVLLAFIKPIINAKGFDFKEVQISEEQRLDVVITFIDKKYVLELKIWKGPESHEKGLLQLERYLENQELKKGFLVIFNFNKKQPVEWTESKRLVADKEIFMVVV